MSTFKKSALLLVASLAVALVWGTVANAAAITTVMTEDFSDATLDPLLTNWNSTPISGGIADLNGSNPTGTAQGFTMSIASYNSNNANSGGPLVSWIMEAIVPDAYTATGLDALMSFNGNYSTSFLSPNWGMSYPSCLTTTVATPQNGDHVALVYTYASAAGTMEYYLNGVLQASGAPSRRYSTASNLAGWGLEVHAAVTASRGFDGSLDAIAFSTFTGTFDPVQNGGTDQFALVIPEPSTLALLATGLIGLLCYAWRKRR